MPRIAVICGTGMSDLSGEFNVLRPNTIVRIETDWGDVPVTLSHLSEGSVAVLDRHHSPGNSRTPPHMIEHRANVMALKSLNPDILMSVNSVGSMRNDMPPGIIGISSDVLDLSVRPWTFYDRDAVHYDRTSIFDNRAMDICSRSLKLSQGSCPEGITVAQCVGPQFESPTEIIALEKLGADTVGMTLGPESRLVSEIGISYVALACSSNWAAGKDPQNPKNPISHHSVDKLASTMRARVSACVTSLLEEFRPSQSQS